MIYCFTAILWFGLLTLRVPGRWALSVFEVALCALAIAALARRGFALRPHPVAVLLGLAAAWGLLQLRLGISVDPDRTSQAILDWTIRCAAFSLGFALTGDKIKRQFFLRAQLLFALGLSLAALIGFFTVSELGPFAYKNQFAAYVESVLGLAILAAIRDRRRFAVWLFVAAALLASVAASGSRAGTILCLAELLVLPALAFARGWLSGRALLRTAGCALLAVVALVEVAGWQTVWKRFQQPHPYSVRADLLRSSAAMLRDRPWTGFGLGTWSSAYPKYALYDDGTFVNQAHNDWAQWAVEGGAPFLLLMLTVAALLIRPGWRSLWGLGLLAVFVHAWVDYPFEQRPALAAFFFALAGVLSREFIFSPAINPRRESPASARFEN